MREMYQKTTVTKRRGRLVDATGAAWEFSPDGDYVSIYPLKGGALMLPWRDEKRGSRYDCKKT